MNKQRILKNTLALCHVLNISETAGEIEIVHNKPFSFYLQRIFHIFYIIFTKISDAIYIESNKDLALAKYSR